MTMDVASPVDPISRRSGIIGREDEEEWVAEDGRVMS